MDLNKLFSETEKNYKQPWAEAKKLPKLIPIIEKEIVKYNKNRKQASPTEFRASEIGSCDRSWLYKQKLGQPEIDWQSYIIMNVGTVVHELIQEYLKDHLVSLEEQLYFNISPGDSSPNTFLGGSYDGELFGRNFGEKENILLEIKTTGVNNYQRLITNKGQLSNKYKFQNNVYLHSKGLKKTVFLFFNRNAQLTDEFKEEYKDTIENYNPVFHEIIYEKDDEIVEKIRQKITDRKLHFKLGTMPKREKISDCNYCSFKERCDQDNEQEKIDRREAKKELTKSKKEKKDKT